MSVYLAGTDDYEDQIEVDPKYLKHKPNIIRNIENFPQKPVVEKVNLQWPQNVQVQPIESFNSDQNSAAARHIGENTEISNQSQTIIRIAFVAVGETSADQAVVMMKSVLMFNKVKVHFTAFCDQASANYIQGKMHSLPGHILEKGALVFYNYNTSFQVAKNMVKDWKRFINFDSSGSILKLLIPSLFPDYRKILIVDTDVLFFVDVAKIWDHFKKFSGGHIMALGSDGYMRHTSLEAQKSSSLSDGIMLVDINKSKSARFLENIISYFNRHSGDQISLHQGLINMYYRDYPEFIYEFPCDVAFQGRFDACYKHTEKRRDWTCERVTKKGVSILHGLNKNPNSAHNSTKNGLSEVIHGYHILFDGFKKLNFETDLTWACWDQVLSKFLLKRYSSCSGNNQFSSAFLEQLKRSLVVVFNSLHKN